MSLKRTLKELFTFSKKERIAIIVLLLIALVLAVLPFYKFGSRYSKEVILDSSLIAEDKQLKEIIKSKNITSEETDVIATANYSTKKAEDISHNSATENILFSFDPNTLDANGFKKLGLRERTIKTIFNYRNKGGKFRKPDDFKKIYNLRKDEFERVKSYIAIKTTAYSASYNNNSKLNYEKPHNTSIPVSESKPKYQRKIIEINSADISAYESLYGIGNKLASRIINFRNKLGGFYFIEQVGETYGVPDSTFQKIKSQLQVNRNLVNKINVNTANYDELNNHPYINRQTAYLILKHRKEKGSLSIEIVQEIVSQTNDQFEKIAPYIRTD